MDCYRCAGQSAQSGRAAIVIEVGMGDKNKTQVTTLELLHPIYDLLLVARRARIQED
jgi:hypothetical protein